MGSGLYNAPILDYTMSFETKNEPLVNAYFEKNSLIIIDMSVIYYLKIILMLNQFVSGLLIYYKLSTSNTGYNSNLTAKCRCVNLLISLHVRCCQLLRQKTFH